MANLGEALRAAGDVHGAIGVLERVLESNQNSSSPDYQLFDTYAFLGKAYNDAQQFEKAIEVLELALEISRGAFGNESDITISVLSSRASVLYRLDREEEALRSHLEAFEIASTKPKNHPLRVTLANNLAMAYSKLGRF